MQSALPVPECRGLRSGENSREGKYGTARERPPETHAWAAEGGAFSKCMVPWFLRMHRPQIPVLESKMVVRDVAFWG